MTGLKNGSVEAGHCIVGRTKLTTIRSRIAAHTINNVALSLTSRWVQFVRLVRGDDELYAASVYTTR